MSRDASTEERGVEPPKVPRSVENIGSTARDACAVERNYLAYLRLGLLLSLLSSSILLNTRLSGRGGRHEFTKAQIPLGSLYFVASFCAILAGWRAYSMSMRGFLERKGFIGFKIHEIAIGVIAMLVSGTCIYLLVLES